MDQAKRDALIEELITLPAKTPCFSLRDVGGLLFLW